MYKKKEAVLEKRENLKVHLIVKGYLKRKWVDYDEIFSPVVRQTSIRPVLALVAHLDMQLEQMAVNTTFMEI